MNTLKSVMMGAGLLFAAGAANATPAYTPSMNTVLGNTFEDFLSVTMPVGSNGSGSASVTAAAGSTITEFELLDMSVNKDETSFFAKGTVSADGSFASFTYSGLNLAHTYKLEIEGCYGSCTVAPVILGGTITGSTSPVPEVSEWAMMASGLGLFGFIGIRRSGMKFKV